MLHFRTPFYGRSSPLNFCWGRLDLHHARFRGRLHERANRDAGLIVRCGENEELAVDCWPDSGADPDAVVYAHLSATPDGVVDLPIQRGSWEPQTGMCLLPYDDLRAQVDPDAALLAVSSGVGEGSAQQAGWDRAALAGNVPAGQAP